MLGKSLPFIFLLFIRICTGSTEDYPQCEPSCGNITIRYPFYLKDYSLWNCSYYGYPVVYGLSCENNRTVLYLDKGKYLVQSINYMNFTIRIVDAGLLERNCSSMPDSSFECYKYYPYFESPYSCYINEEPSRTVLYVECANEIDSPFYTKTSPCVKSRNSSSAFPHVNGHLYIVDAHNASCLHGSCKIRWVTRTSWPESRSYDQLTYEDIHKELVYGFELSWLSFYCDYIRHGYGHRAVQENHAYKLDCPHNNRVGWILTFIWYILSMIWEAIYVISHPRTIKYLFPSRHPYGLSNAAAYVAFYIGFLTSIWFSITRAIGVPCVLIFLVYKWRRRHRAGDENIEEFLQNQKKLFPIRYSYSHIKKIARNFKDKLGEGGYGSVYKGKLKSGQDVAIKILKNDKANGQDFINEVATIGKIHHVNVVRLIGFCIEGSKRALIYDFMPNGSLDKHIFHRENNISLRCKEIFEISLGIARGIEYLHGGCGMQILHFDIKPHNILLDENFIPKISDFGLAKLYPTSHNTVSITAARGTLGYMAPELVYKTIGRVSYKADVYSFGKLLMEMACRRKNVDATIERSSQIYFPSWVYNQLIAGNNIEIVELMEEEERGITKKMMIVALWCIQMNPDDRPSMNKVVRMLEGLENLLMPSKPLSYPPEVQVQISEIDTNFNLMESSFVSSSLNPNGFSSRSGDIIDHIESIG